MSRKKIKTSRPRIVNEKIHIKGEVDHIHEKTYRVKAHYIHRNGKRIYIPAHTVHRHVKTYKTKPHTIRRKEIRFAGHFKEVADRIAKEYMKKGYSKREAEQIGKKTAGAIYRHKLAKAYRR